MKTQKINERPGVAVCICGKNGTIIRHEPELYLKSLRDKSAKKTSGKGGKKR